MRLRLMCVFFCIWICSCSNTIVETTVLSPLNCFCIIVKNQLAIFVWVYFFLFLFLFYLRESTSGAEGLRERDKKTPCWSGSPMWGSVPRIWAHDLSWRQTLRSDWATQVPRLGLFLHHLFFSTDLFMYNTTLSWLL